MVRAAIIGIGRWGRTLVGAVQGKSQAIRFTAGHNRTRAHAEAFCAEHGIVHYLVDPGKPAQNGTVERSHREDQEKFYERHRFSSFGDLRRKVIVWNEEYNDLEHCGLNGKTPNEALALMS